MFGRTCSDAKAPLDRLYPMTGRGAGRFQYTGQMMLPDYGPDHRHLFSAPVFWTASLSVNVQVSP